MYLKNKEFTTRGLLVAFFCSLVLTGSSRANESENDRLLQAIKANDSAKVVRALKHGADPNATRVVGYLNSPTGSIGSTGSTTSAPRKTIVHTCPLIVALDWRSRFWSHHGFAVVGYQPGDPPPENPALVKALLQAGADVHARNEANYTPLMIAAWQGRVSTVELLLHYDKQLDAGGKEGWTALMLAISNGDLKTINSLIEHGADINTVKCKQGYTALSLAQTRGDVEIQQILERHLGSKKAEK